jgi:hypothetical protein
MKTPAKSIPNLANLSSNERMELEDQIEQRAFALWRKKGHGHRDALNALRQAEREVLTPREQSSPTDKSRKLRIKTD